MDIQFLVKLTSRAWALAILALMDQGVPGRQATLLAQTGAGRSAFGQSMTHLIELGLIERTPGHGHPLRPEYRLTDQGRPVARMASRINAAMPDNGAGGLLRRVWTLPVLAVCQGPRFFSDIKSALQPITDRALSQSLQQLQGQDWLRREVNPSERPLRPAYAAVGPGFAIGEAARQMLV